MLVDSLKKYESRLPDFSITWERLLLAVGCAVRSSDDLSGLKGLSETEWNSLLDLSIQHWVAPLLYPMIKARGDDLAVPRTIRCAFKRVYLWSRVRSNQIFTRIQSVLTAFKNANIDVIALKGTHLAALVYGDIALRPMIDVDFLVRSTDLETATQILVGLGFQQDHQDRAHFDDAHHHLSPFRHPEAPPIELHRNLGVAARARILDIEELWHRAEWGQIAGVTVLVLSAEDLLLHLCLHAAVQHLFSVKLLSLCDIPMVLNHYRDRIDWVTFWERARIWRVERSVFITLILVERRLACCLPEGTKLGLRPIGTAVGRDILIVAAENNMREKAATLAQLDNRPKAQDCTRFSRIHNHLEANGNEHANAPIRPSKEHFSGNLAKIWDSTTLTGKMEIIFSRTFLPRYELGEIFGISPNSYWLPLLYPVRLGQLLIRYSRLVLRVLRREPRTVDLLNAEVTRNRLRDWLRGSQA
ncbi:conserved hypothetical protein [Gammaproteobacteria bacterium]